MLHSSLLHETVQLAIDDHVLILNSAADPFMLEAAQSLSVGELILAEDNLALLQQFIKLIGADASPMNKIVGADLSRPSPIYRSSAARTRTLQNSIASSTRSLP